jgi:hypothetical protein
MIAGVASVSATALSLPAGQGFLSRLQRGGEAVAPMSCPGPLALGHHYPAFPADAVAITAEVAQLWVAPVRCGLPACPSFCLRVVHHTHPNQGRRGQFQMLETSRLGSVLARAAAKLVSYGLRQSLVIRFPEK